MGPSLIQSRREFRQYLWPIASVGLLGIHTALLFTLGPGVTLTGYSMVSFFLLLLAKYCRS